MGVAYGNFMRLLIGSFDDALGRQENAPPHCLRESDKVIEMYMSIIRNKDNTNGMTIIE